MIKSIINPPWKDLQDLKELMNIIPDIKIVGGAVRNALLGIPIKDIDLATSLLPQEITKIARANNFKVIPTGLQHGTVTCVKTNAYEITTLRIDKQTDGRHAVVEFSTSWELDAKRRDFTINALYSDFDGNITDYINGTEDLLNKTIRFIGDPKERIKEDYLRILRFFRFYSYYGKTYDEQSLQACINYGEELIKISRERCTDEFIKIMQSNTWKGIKLMPDNMLVSSGLPTPNKELIKKLQLEEIKINKKASFYAKIACFSSDHHLVLSNKMRSILDQLYNLKPMNSISQYIYWINNSYSENLWDGILLKGQINERILPYIPIWIDNKFPLRGQDIVDIGIKPGNQIREYLNIAFKHFAESPVPLTKEELLIWIKKII